MGFGNFSNALLKRRFLIITETVIVNPDCCSSFPLSPSFSFLLSSFLLLKVEDTAVDIRNYYNADDTEVKLSFRCCLELPRERLF